MLAEAKDISELMVDLAYAALYFGDPDMAEEVDELNEDVQVLASDMRTSCVLGARNLKEAEAMVRLRATYVSSKTPALNCYPARATICTARCWHTM